MSIKTIKNICDIVKAAGHMAAEEQKHLLFSQRDYKKDGSVLTSVDQKVEQYLCGEIERLFPDANIVTEESERPFDAGKPYTFVIDPIDGTDMFSQGMPGWCVAVGVLDAGLNPIAGVIYAPRWGSFYFADIHSHPLHNGTAISRIVPLEPDSLNANLMVTSRIFRFSNLKNFEGKIRSIGSGALQMCMPLISPGVIAAILGKTHIWDIAAATAIVTAAGLHVEYLSGDKILFQEILDGRPAMDLILCGSEQSIAYLRQIF